MGGVGWKAKKKKEKIIYTMNCWGHFSLSYKLLYKALLSIHAMLVAQQCVIVVKTIYSVIPNLV